MPIDYLVDSDLRVVFAEAQGVVTDAELLAYAAKTANDPQLRSGLHELVDLRAADVHDISGQAVREVAAIFGDHDRPSSGARIAIVASGDAAYGLSRMYQAYRGRDAVELRVFRDIAEARRWLGLPAE